MTTTKEMLPEEILTVLLSYVPVRGVIRRLDEQLVNILNEQPQDSLLGRHFPITEQHSNSPTLTQTLLNLRCNGALRTIGPVRTVAVTQATHNLAERYKQGLSDDERKYLEGIAAKIQYEE